MFIAVSVSKSFRSRKLTAFFLKRGIKLLPCHACVEKVGLHKRKLCTNGSRKIPWCCPPWHGSFCKTFSLFTANVWCLQARVALLFDVCTRVWQHWIVQGGPVFEGSSFGKSCVLPHTRNNGSQAPPRDMHARALLTLKPSDQISLHASPLGLQILKFWRKSRLTKEPFGSSVTCTRLLWQNISAILINVVKCVCQFQWAWSDNVILNRTRQHCLLLNQVFTVCLHGPSACCFAGSWVQCWREEPQISSRTIVPLKHARMNLLTVGLLCLLWCTFSKVSEKNFSLTKPRDEETRSVPDPQNKALFATAQLGALFRSWKLILLFKLPILQLTLSEKIRRGTVIEPKFVRCHSQKKDMWFLWTGDKRCAHEPPGSNLLQVHPVSNSVLQVRHAERCVVIIIYIQYWTSLLWFISKLFALHVQIPLHWWKKKYLWNTVKRLVSGAATFYFRSYVCSPNEKKAKESRVLNQTASTVHSCIQREVPQLGAGTTWNVLKRELLDCNKHLMCLCFSPVCFSGRRIVQIFSDRKCDEVEPSPSGRST